MINPASPNRGFTVRELMNLMGMPKDFKEIPAKDINVLFQNVPVNTVKTLVTALVSAKNYYKPMHEITRVNNIKQQIEVF
jgi:site-specific DNA-cytosine methylase